MVNSIDVTDIKVILLAVKLFPERELNNNNPGTVNSQCIENEIKDIFNKIN